MTVSRPQRSIYACYLLPHNALRGLSVYYQMGLSGVFGCSGGEGRPCGLCCGLSLLQGTLNVPLVMMLYRPTCSARNVAERRSLQSTRKSVAPYYDCPMTARRFSLPI
eukprot:scaffold138137_cov16-Prasinocladus_malaysianus.AAC.1